MFRILAVAGIAWLSLGFPAPFNARVSAPLRIEPSDTLILTSRAPSDSIVRFVLPLGDLKANFELRTRWLNIHADTLELPSPAVFVMKDQPIDIWLASRPGDPVLRLAFSYGVANGST